MDEYGHYTSMSWFEDLERRQLYILLKNTVEIWSHRLNLNDETRCLICPPNGILTDRHHSVNEYYRRCETEILREYVLSIFEKLVYSGQDEEHRSLGVFYVLGSLTLVSREAGQELPYLRDYFLHINIL